jgi:hypothetical protein
METIEIALAYFLCSLTFNILNDLLKGLRLKLLGVFCGQSVRINPEQSKWYKSKIELCLDLPFMFSDLVYKFHMICMRGT